MKKRFLLLASAALLLACTTSAHRAASDDDDSLPKIEDPTKISEDAPFIENLMPKGEEEAYEGPKDFTYCKFNNATQKIYRLQQVHL